MVFHPEVFPNEPRHQRQRPPRRPKTVRLGRPGEKPDQAVPLGRREPSRSPSLRPGLQVRLPPATRHRLPPGNRARTDAQTPGHLADAPSGPEHRRPTPTPGLQLGLSSLWPHPIPLSAIIIGSPRPFLCQMRDFPRRPPTAPARLPASSRPQPQRAGGASVPGLRRDKPARG